LIQTGSPQALQAAQDAYLKAPGPDSADTLGWFLLQSGTPAEKVLPLLRDASMQKRQDPTIGYHYAVALQATSKPEEVQAVLERVLRAGSTFDEEAAARALLQQVRSR
jgi:hypothetical protein